MTKKLDHGQSLCVLGSIPELGTWHEFKHHMKNIGNDTWESVSSLFTQNFFFQYKYCIMVENGTKRIGWEKGVDRLADLELMPDMQDSRG